jgi:cholesterol transport system auxiliary component
MRLVNVWLVLALLPLSGCGFLRNPVAPVRYYTLDPPLPRAAAGGPANATLAVRSLSAASPYRERIVFRTGETAIGFRDTDRWAEPPAEMLTAAFERALRAANVARDVVDDRMIRRADFILEGRLTRFDEVQGTAEWTAQCELELVLRSGEGDRILLATTLAASQAAKSRATPDFVEAMRAAVGEILAKATPSIAKALAENRPDPARP